jgi:hypothetical protein
MFLEQESKTIELSAAINNHSHMLRTLALFFLFFSSMGYAQCKISNLSEKDITVLTSIEGYKMLNGFYAGDANSNCIYEFDSTSSLKVIPYSCVRRMKPMFGSYKIDKNSFTISVEQDTTTYEVVKYKGYYFFVEINNRTAFVNDVAIAVKYLKQGKSGDHPVIYLRNKYFYKEIEP